MAKLALLLSVLAAAVAAYAALRPVSGGVAVEDSKASTVSGLDAPTLRQVKDVARKEAETKVSESLADVNRAIVKLEQLKKQFELAVSEARRLGEASADAVAARVDTVDRDARQALKAVRTEIEAVRDRAPVPSAVAPPSAPTPEEEEEPAEPEPAQPTQPTPPPAPTVPALSEAERNEIEKALADLEQTEVTKLFAAMETLRKRKVREAGPRLTKILTTHKDPFARMGAASALGGILIADGMEALIEALVDEDASVATQASKAIRQITDRDLDFSAKAGIRERRKAKSEMKQWWKDHEQEVRERLGQPKATAPSEGR
jgi:HEAT repeat protein